MTVITDLPAGDAEAVTPSDTVDLIKPSRGIYVGTGGDLTVVMAGNGAVVTFVAVVAGSLLPLWVKRVNAASTTAANIISVR